MQKRFAFPLILAVMVLLFTNAFQAQVKTITEAEYDLAYRSAMSAANISYPRIETYTSKPDGLQDVRFRTVRESAERSYEEMKITTSYGTYLAEKVRFDGEYFERTDKGTWRRPGPEESGAAYGILSSIKTYTGEEKTIGGETIKLYTETTTSLDGKKLTSTVRTDSRGRMLEYHDVIYEYPKTVPPIKKPVLGTKSDL